MWANLHRQLFYFEESFWDLKSLLQDTVPLSFHIVSDIVVLSEKALRTSANGIHFSGANLTLKGRRKQKLKYK